MSLCGMSTLTIEEWETASSVQVCCMGKCESTEAGKLFAVTRMSESNPENNISSQSSHCTRVPLWSRVTYLMASLILAQDKRWRRA
jgi:hypothetical protein